LSKHRNSSTITYAYSVFQINFADKSYVYYNVGSFILLTCFDDFIFLISQHMSICASYSDVRHFESRHLTAYTD
jgi:hypothetical protein